jgi:hypothetical protein
MQGFVIILRVSAETHVEVSNSKTVMTLARVIANISVTVTAIGQSVGASDISLQLTAFGGEHGVPFQRAMSVSTRNQDALSAYTLADSLTV